MNNDQIKRFNSAIKDNTTVMINILECSIEEETQNFLTFDFFVSNDRIKECLCEELKGVYDLDKTDELDSDLLGTYYVGDNALVINMSELLLWCNRNNIYANIIQNHLNQPNMIAIEFEKIPILKQELK